MQVNRLAIRDFRAVRDAAMVPCGRLNLLVGENGAGKTTVLEALHLMAHGRSFRGRVRDGLVRNGASALEVFVEWDEAGAHGLRGRRAGLRHSGTAWSGRLDGADVRQLGDLCAALAVTTFEPGSHALITGGGEARRRYLDWGLFHVEPAFLPLWRRYSRALRQRNALLKSRASGGQLDAWDHELAEAGEPLARQREQYLRDLEPAVAATAEALSPSLGAARLEYLPGWRRDAMPLADALLNARERDLLLGHSTVGPHRADWRLELAAVPGRDALSRGQAKLAALATLFGQARLHADATGTWPVIALDDIASELDRQHRRRVFEWLAKTPAQVFATGTEAPVDADGWPDALTVFHVEHGLVEVAAP